MTETETGVIERACERLILDFAWFSDRHDYESLAGLFAEDGIMIRPAGHRLSGRTAIAESYRSRPATRITRHVCTNIRVSVESADRARAWTYAIVYSANAADSPEAHFGVAADARRLIGEFEDQFIRTADGWRIAERRAIFIMHT